MTTTGIEAVFLTTHNWGKAAGFFKALGYELEFDTGHSSGQLRNGDSPYVFIAEVPADEDTAMQIVLRIPDADALELPASIDVASSFEDTHWGTRLMTVTDPDGRVWSLEAPAHQPES